MDNLAACYLTWYRTGVLIMQMARFVPNGQGKSWAKGRTAVTDARIAHNAERRRGMTYERHLTPAQDRRYRNGGARTLPLEWSDKMAYVVGLMATDGNLSKRRSASRLRLGRPSAHRDFPGVSRLAHPVPLESERVGRH